MQKLPVLRFALWVWRQDFPTVKMVNCKTLQEQCDIIEKEVGEIDSFYRRVHCARYEISYFAITTYEENHYSICAVVFVLRVR